MANIRLSDLPAATSLDGTEIVPIVQSGTTKRTTISAIESFEGEEAQTPWLSDIDANGFDLLFDDATGILDSAGNEQLIFQETASAVNYLEIANAATGGRVIISEKGDGGLGFSLDTGVSSMSPGILFDLQDNFDPQVMYTSELGGATGPYFLLWANSATPAANDWVGQFIMQGNDSAASVALYGRVKTVLLDPTNGSEDGMLALGANIAATSPTDGLLIHNGVYIGSSAPTAWPGTGNLAFADACGIFDGAGNEQLLFQQTASAVNYFEITNSATGVNPTISAAGSDANVGMNFAVQGSGAGSIPYTFNLGTGLLFNLETNNTGTSGVIVQLWTNANSAAVGDNVGSIYCEGNDSANNNSRDIYAVLASFVADPTSGSEDGRFIFQTAIAGSLTTGFRIQDGAALGSSVPTTWAGNGNLQFIDAKGIFDADANEWLVFQKTASAVNYFEITNAATTTYPILSAAGDDTNIGLRFSVKGDPAMSATAHPIQFDLGATNQASVFFVNTSAGSTGPGVVMYQNSATPTAGDYVGAFEMWGNDSAVGPNNCVSIWGQWVDNTDLSEDGKLIFYTTIGGSGYRAQMLMYNGIYIPGAGADGSPTAWPGAGNIGFATGKGFTDINGNEQLLFTSTASAVNYLTITNAATLGYPTISAAGDDADIGMTFTAKGAAAGIDFNLGSANFPVIGFTGTDATGGGPVFNIFSNSATPAAADTLSFVRSQGKDDGGTTTNYTEMISAILDPANGSEDAELYFRTFVAGTNARRMSISDGIIIGTGTTYPGAGNVHMTDSDAILTMGSTSVTGSNPTLQMGNLLFAEQAAPATINMGGTYADAVDAAKLKWTMFQSSGSAIYNYGLGMSAARFNAHYGEAGSFALVTRSTETVARFTGSLTSNDIQLILGSTSASGSAPKLRMGNTTTSGSTAPAQIHMGNTYATSLDSGSAKWIFFDGGSSDRYGIGITAAQYNYFISGLSASYYVWNWGETSVTTMSSAAIYPAVNAGLTVGTSANAFSNTWTNSVDLSTSADTTITRFSSGVLAVEGVPVISGGINTTTSTNYTLSLGDATKTIEMGSSQANTLTIPTSGSVNFPNGTYINVTNTSTAVTTITPASTAVTVNSRLGLISAGQYAMFTIYKSTANTWYASGDLTT